MTRHPYLSAPNAPPTYLKRTVGNEHTGDAGPLAQATSTSAQGPPAEEADQAPAAFAEKRAPDEAPVAEAASRPTSPLGQGISEMPDSRAHEMAPLLRFDRERARYSARVTRSMYNYCMYIMAAESAAKNCTAGEFFAKLLFKS